MQHATLRRIDHARHSHADTFARAELFMVGKYLLDATREFLDQHINVAIRLKTADNSELPAHQIGDEDVSPRRANIDTDNTTLARVDVKKGRPAAATDGFTESAFEDQRLARVVR